MSPPVVMATGYVVGAVTWVGSTHVGAPVEQAAVGYPAVAGDVMLPLVENVPVSASVAVGCSRTW